MAVWSAVYMASPMEAKKSTAPDDDYDMILFRSGKQLFHWT